MANNEALNELIKQLSQGNENLERAIRETHKKGIDIYQCGVGDQEAGVYPYIAFRVNAKSARFANNLLQECLNLFGNTVQINFFKEEEKFIMYVSIIHKYKDALFNLVTELSNDTSFTQNDIMACIVYLMNIVSKASLDFKAVVSLKKMYIGILDKDDEFIYNDACPELSEFIKEAKEERSIPKQVYKCDLASLIELTQIIYNVEPQQPNQKKKDKAN